MDIPNLWMDIHPDVHSWWWFDPTTEMPAGLLLFKSKFLEVPLVLLLPAVSFPHHLHHLDADSS